ncbi:hypothetical protein [Nonomuraea sp. NPDC050783]|uniref:hypothetical protein n=1 Tax=Nonomuraea sp. NPDC050783 TaxID=3154634 RepID=UPI0034666AF1
MAGLIAELLHPHEIDRHLYGISDVEETWHLPEIPTDPSGWVGAGDNGIQIEEPSERCRLKFELWDGPPPPPPPGSYDRTWTGRVRIGSGRVFAVSGHGGGTRHGPEFELGRPGATWNVGVHRKALGHEEFPVELVSFSLLKIRFWPMGDDER